MVGRLKALVVGFVLGIFLAPRSGRDSRRLLIERINEFFDLGEDRYEALEEELAERAAARDEPAAGAAEPSPPEESRGDEPTG